jgi:hypothetical protein
MLAYERLEDETLVLAAGVPEAWVREAPGVRVRELPTHFGALTYTMCAEGDGRVRVTLGAGVYCPRGGIVIESPFERPARAVLVDGRPQPVTDPRRVSLHAMAREVLIDY